MSSVLGDISGVYEALEVYGIYSGRLNMSNEELLKVYEEYIKKGEWEYKRAYSQYYRRISNTEGVIGEINREVENVLGRYKTRDIYGVRTIGVDRNEIRGHATGWHTDYKGSYGLMILMSEVRESDTHMEYEKGDRVKEGQRDMSLRGYEVMKCIGEVGRYYIFDNGHRLHRMNMKVGSIRETIHGIYLPKG